MKYKSENNQKRILEQTLDRLSNRSKAPKSVFVILLILYFATTMIVSISAGSKADIMIAGISFPIYTFAGVFSSLANICVILLAVYCGKAGFFSALTVLLIQLPMVLSGVIFKHNYTSLPGVFINIMTIFVIFVIYLNNIKVEKYQTKLRDQAVTDILTGLPNRFACSELVNDLSRHNIPFTAVTIDINDFKSINDTMGFNTGNKVLTAVAARWKAIADNGLSGTLDFITRLSGDEFALVIRNYHSEEDILHTIKQYETALEEKLVIDEYDFYPTASFGYAEFPTDAQDIDSLFSFSSVAMKEIKHVNSSDHILRFTPELLKEGHTLEVENKIRTAIENNTIYFNLQPQYDMSHKLRGFEALARMKDKDGSIISPGEFIPVAEKVGLIDKVDGIVFQKSTAFIGDLVHKTGADIILSVNVSVRHLMKNNFLEEIQELLAASGLPARQLEIEITESIMIDSAEKALICINKIRDLGIKVAIDDFGTGYSSLSYLYNFPANLLKIDKSFIDKMNTSESSKQYVASIISIGHIMGFDVISEGVEDDEQLETLRSIDCDYIQGFIWGRPLPPEDAAEVVFHYLNESGES